MVSRRHKAVRAIGKGDNRQLMQRAEGVAAGQHNLDIQRTVFISLHTGLVGHKGDGLPRDIDTGSAKALQRNFTLSGALRHTEFIGDLAGIAREPLLDN